MLVSSLIMTYLQNLAVNMIRLTPLILHIMDSDVTGRRHFEW